MLLALGAWWYVGCCLLLVLSDTLGVAGCCCAGAGHQTAGDRQGAVRDVGAESVTPAADTGAGAVMHGLYVVVSSRLPRDLQYITLHNDTDTDITA